MKIRDKIKRSLIKHNCRLGACSQDHDSADLVELPAALFVDFCGETEKRYDGTEQAPD